MERYDLEGQVALITGSSKGIGASVARAFAGADVMVNYRSHPEEALRVASEIVDAGGQADTVEADVADEADVERMVERTVHAFGQLDIVVPNAGIQRDAPFADMTLDDWRTVLDVNLTGSSCAPERDCVASVRKRTDEAAPGERSSS